MAPVLSVLKGIYYGNTPGALRGPQALYEQAKKLKVKGITLAKCKSFLASQPVYTRNRPARKNYERNKVEASIPGDVVQVDIMDMQRFRDSNDYLYVLLSYDTFSKLLSGVPLLNRRPDSVEAGLETLMRGSPFPWLSIYWDKEGSFLSHRVQAFLKDRSVHNYTTKSVVKAPGVERAIRTLRTLLQRRFEASGSTKWEKEIPKLIASYNKRKHSTTKLVPNELALNPLLLTPEKPKKPQRTFNLPPIGSHVRLNRLRGIFEKESSNTWTEEVFKVVRHKTHMPIPLVYVEDMMGEAIAGGLYPEEYQLVKWSGKKDVEKILKERKLPGQPREWLVAYKGWPKKFNAWVRTKPALK